MFKDHLKSIKQVHFVLNVQGLLMLKQMLQWSGSKGPPSQASKHNRVKQHLTVLVIRWVTTMEQNESAQFVICLKIPNISVKHFENVHKTIPFAES